LTVSCLSSRVLAALGSALLSLTAAAQSGDRPNDPQQPPPEHWDIPEAPALAVEDALKTFALAPGFRIEVVAADPLVFDPIAMQIGPDGRIWVVEMRGYMPNVDGIGEDAPIGTIAVLSDTDGDGRMDHRTEFADGLVMPRGVALVDDGVLVAAPPTLWHMRDTDGDDIADERTVVSETYGDRQNPEHTANGLLWGLDNWIYNANDDERYRWNHGAWESAAAPDRGQWGIAQDDAGRLFYNTNSSPLKFDLFPGEYLLRNPDLHSHQAINRKAIANRDLPLFPSRITPGVNRGYRILDEDGYLPHMTAASAPVIYRGSAFPDVFYGDAFIPEPAGNLIKRLQINQTNDGDWAGTNPYDHFEFLTSTDERFRPVSLYNGPDGALYIVDMYRGIIQHRIFVTSFLRAQIIERGLETPIGMGRIYRVVPVDAEPAPAPTLHTATTDELVAALHRQDAWWRETAQRLLVEQRDFTAVPALKEIALNPTHPGHLNAIWTLHGINALEPRILRQVAAATHADGRLTLLKIHEPWLRSGRTASLDFVIDQLDAPEPEVRRQAVLSVGELTGPKRVNLLAAFASRGDTLAGLDEAMVSGLAGYEIDFLKALRLPLHPHGADVAKLAAATVIERASADEVTALLDLLLAPSTDPSFATALLGGIEDHTQNRKGDRMRLSLPVEPTALIKFAGKGNAELAARANALLGYIDGPAAQAAMAEVTPLTESEQILFNQGKVVYALCAGCHQANGRGMNGLAPSLVGSKWAVGPDEVAAAIVLKGKEGAQLAMPPLESLDDTSIAAALTFIRRSWGHTASAVTPEVVATARENHHSRSSAWDEDALAELSATLNP
jgi:glucose/arabinose dehydrogenase/mono/diheme cytochrome c family protein